MNHTYPAPTPNSHTACYDAGALRAYLDGELPIEASAETEAHIGACSDCQARLAELRALDAQIAAALSSMPSPPVHRPSADDAWAASSPSSPLDPRPRTACRVSSPACPRTGRSELVPSPPRAVVVLLVPPAQSLAAQLLQIFRAQSVIYVLVSPQRIEQLENLHLDQSALFLTPPSLVGSAPTTTPAASINRRAVSQGSPSRVPMSSQYADERRCRRPRPERVSVAGERADITPDARGAGRHGCHHPLLARRPANHYSDAADGAAADQGNGYTLSLTEGTSPTVNPPAGVDLAQRRQGGAGGLRTDTAAGG